MVVRDPFDRAAAQFTFWRRGSLNRLARRPAARAQWLRDGEASLEAYLRFVASRAPYDDRRRAVGRWLRWKPPDLPVSHWVRPGDFSKTVAIEWAPDLSYCVGPLLTHLGASPAAAGPGPPLLGASWAPWPAARKGATWAAGREDTAAVEWTPAARALAEKIYAADFALLRAVRETPERFEKVIRRGDAA